MKIPEQVKKTFENISLVAFSTADKDGNPNTVPIFWKKIVNDGKILLIDNFMKMSKQNVLENNKVCISFWNPETEEAYKIKGTAIYHDKGPVYDEGKIFIQEKKPGRIPKGVVEITVEEIYSITPGSDAGKKL